MLEAALASPRHTYAGADLYPTLASKAAALGFAIIQTHPFVDGNKRVGHAAMEVFLMLNGKQLNAEVDESERMILAVASGKAGRDEFRAWIENRLEPL